MKRTITFLGLCLLAHLVATAQLIDFDTLQTSTVTDVDGNVYKTILFGDTWWMAENLRTKHYSDGSDILQQTVLMDANDIQNDWSYWYGVGRWGYSNFDSTNVDTYGLLYSWHAAVNICPEGWGLADTGAWWALNRLIVGNNNFVTVTGTRPTPDGGKESYIDVNTAIGVARYLKSDNGELWTMEPTISRSCNQSGMGITPAGEISTSIDNFGEYAEFWTPNFVHEDGSGCGRRYIHFDYKNHDMNLGMNHAARLRSVRCVKKAHFLKLSSKTITLDSALNSSALITVTANDEWMAQTHAQWLLVEQDTTAGDGTLTITTTSANTSSEARSDTVFVSMDDPDTDTIKLVVSQSGRAITAIGEIQSIQKEITIYPNPANGQLNILSETEIKQIEIISMTGKIMKVVLQSNVVLIEDLSPAIYLVKITTANGTTIKRVMKE